MFNNIKLSFYNCELKGHLINYKYNLIKLKVFYKAYKSSSNKFNIVIKYASGLYFNKYRGKLTIKN
jgi:hypothetical protein